MTSRAKPRPDDAPTTVWDRPEPTVRPSPSPLSRDRIVRAAIAIADQEGLAAVSLRKVGAALDAGPMRLYSYLSTKEELLELMVDAVYGELVATGPVEAGWRDALQTIARRTRQAARTHPWFSDLLGGRPRQGPNALTYLEASFAALGDTPGFEDIEMAMRALRAVNAYIIGAVQSEASELRAEHESGMTRADWLATDAPYMARMLATGQFPQLSRVVQGAAQLPADMIFDDGLDYLLDGIAARLPAG